MADTLTPTPSYNKTDETNTGNSHRAALIGAIAAVVLLLALLGGAVWLLMQPGTDTARVRDIFIIFMALETLLIGLALIVLIVQLARLINLLQNEVKPILDSTNETANTLRGTAAFLSDNLAEPVIKLNEYVAALQKLV
ncbi:MAG: hypothetical protein D6755_12525, partial [Anaerolineae bacterium]